jgi:SWI/SNF-related matrix-associated actin-dependent regulator of chromatin subfamily A member 5
MNLLMQLRKVCDQCVYYHHISWLSELMMGWISPYMLSLPEPYEIGEHVVETSSKLIAIDKILKKVLPQGERVLIFSQWTSYVFRVS